MTEKLVEIDRIKNHEILHDLNNEICSCIFPSKTKDCVISLSITNSNPSESSE